MSGQGDVREAHASLWRRLNARTFAVAAVSLAAGLLFVTNAALFSGNERQAPDNVADLVQAESDRLQSLEAEVSAMRAQREDLVVAAAGGAQAPGLDPRLAVAAAATAVRGPGVRVSMWDAPAIDTAGTGFDVNDLVVHQQDIEAVMNALWAGGAEAMTVQGQRLTSSSGVRCVGNVLLLHGRQYSPPYVIEAIGDQDALLGALDDSPQVRIYLEYVDAVRLGWEATRLASVTMPAYAGAPSTTNVRLLAQ